MKTRVYEIRDPIHGLIELSKKELDIINTKAFQRLGNGVSRVSRYFAHPIRSLYRRNAHSRKDL